MSPARGAPLQLAVLISGRGSNMVAIARACAQGHIRAAITTVIADVPEAGGLELARSLGLQALLVDRRTHATRHDFEGALGAALRAAGSELVVLAGFMRILSADFVAAFAGRMLNIHPALLPQYPGLHTHERVLQAGERFHGASVHYVTPELDAGPVILQSRIPVRRGETPATLSARVQATEHIIYPRAIGWIADGRLDWHDGRPQLDGRPLTRPVVEVFDGEPAA